MDSLILCAVIYVVGAIVFLCQWSIDCACGALDESRGFTIGCAALWPIMIAFHVIPFGIKCFFDKHTWR